MKVLVLLCGALALAAAGWAPVGYHGPQHVPVIHNGVPVETPEVQHARAAHMAALAEAAARPGYHSIEPQIDEGYGHQDHSGQSYQAYAPVAVHQPIYHSPEPVHYAPAIHKAPVHPAYETSHVLPAIAHDGTPLDTPEVLQAKSHHFAEFSRALAATAPHQPDQPHYGHYRRRRSIYDLHQTHHGYSTHQVHAPVYGHHYEHWTPEYDHHGRPIDTPEVQHAKQAHFQAYHVAAARNAVHGGVWGHQGVHDTPEVAHAKAIHFAAHAAAKGHLY